MKIWCLLRDQFAHVKPIETAFGAEAEFVYDGEWNLATMLAAKPDLVLCINDYPLDVARCLGAARANGIPSLLLQDGILEWRCQYENPLFGAGGGAPQHQPVLADKIACIGHESFRRISTWGNESKVELAGMPRLDYLCGRPFQPPKKPGSRLLILTAKNPGFTSAQRETTLRSLRELKKQLDRFPHLQIFWRVSKSIAEELGVENQLKEIGSAELASIVEKSDAVISTPSTAMLEAMLLGRPVAALDFHNVPRFVRTAWTISAPEHIPNVITELMNPSAVKLSFQNDMLAENLVCDGQSASRIRTLICNMVNVAKRSDLRRCPLPANILGGHRTYIHFTPPTLGQLYPAQSVFEESNAKEMQLRLARAENENVRLKTENAELRKKFQVGSWLKSGVRRIAGGK